LKEKTYIIYKIINLKTSQVYIGSSDKTLPEVVSYFKWAVVNNKTDIPIYEDMRGLPPSYFRWEVVKSVTESYLNDQLKYYITQFKSGDGYNKIIENKSGFKHTEETKLKIAEAHTGMKHTEETREKMSEAHTGEKNINYGKERKQNVIDKLVESKLGVPRDEETKKKISKKLTGSPKKKMSFDKKKQMRLDRAEKEFKFDRVSYNKVIELKKAEIANSEILKQISISESSLYRYLSKAKKEGILE